MSSSIRTIAGNTAALLLMFAAVFWSAGRLDYWQGWMYFAVYLLVTLLIALLVPGEVMAEWRKPGPGAKKWDRLMLALMAPVSFLVPIVSGLDAGRTGWTGPMEPAMSLLAYAVMLPAYAVVIWAMRTNRFYSSVVRIQEERGHQPVRTGPYALVRHPAYTGVILYQLAAPVALGSLAGLVPAAALALIFIVRTALEDATLRRELAGYEDYAAAVRFRLVPGIW